MTRALILAVMLTGCAAHAEPAAADMPTYQEVHPPYGYMGFCIRNPLACEGGTDHPARIELTPEAWGSLNAVNDYVNRLPQVSDEALYGRPEWWAVAGSDGGDCEDLALAKQRLLIERGFPASALLIAVAKQWNGDGHAVLIAATNKGDYVLDSMGWRVEHWRDTSYRWIKRQSAERPFIWINLDRSVARDIAVRSPPLGEPAPFLAALHKNMPDDVAALENCAELARIDGRVC